MIKHAQKIMYGALAAGALFAASVASAMQPRSAMQPLEVFSTPNAHFVSGGVGLNERDELREQANEYNLSVSFARKSDGAYLSYAWVTLEGETLSQPVELTTAGPLLLGSLPPGSYTLSAEVAGWKPVRRAVEVNDSSREHIFIALERAE